MEEQTKGRYAVTLLISLVFAGMGLYGCFQGHPVAGGWLIAAGILALWAA
jgi:hypothetical protein